MGDIKQLAGELERVMRDARVPSGEGFTTTELAEALGCSVMTAQRRVRAWHKAGLVSHAVVMRVSIIGVLNPTPAYVPVTNAAGPCPPTTARRAGTAGASRPARKGKR